MGFNNRQTAEDVVVATTSNGPFIAIQVLADTTITITTNAGNSRNLGTLTAGTMLVCGVRAITALGTAGSVLGYKA